MAFALWCFGDVIKRRTYEEDVLQRIQHVVSSLLPGAVVQAFGSHATGLSVPDSDIDIVVCNTPATSARKPLNLHRHAV